MTATLLIAGQPLRCEDCHRVIGILDGQIQGKLGLTCKRCKAITVFPVAKPSPTTYTSSK